MPPFLSKSEAGNTVELCSICSATRTALRLPFLCHPIIRVLHVLKQTLRFAFSPFLAMCIFPTQYLLCHEARKGAIRFPYKANASHSGSTSHSMSSRLHRSTGIDPVVRMHDQLAIRNTSKFPSAMPMYFGAPTATLCCFCFLKTSTNPIQCEANL
eukprot:SAG31_NODE_181_length_21114_cov_99.705211_10_plen_156_part_00